MRPDPPLDTTGRDLSQRRQPQNGRYDQFCQRGGLPISSVQRPGLIFSYCGFGCTWWGQRPSIFS